MRIQGIDVTYSPISTLTTSEIDELWRFLTGTAAYPREVLEKRLANRDGVYRFRDSEGELRGCLARKTVSAIVEGQPVVAVLAGQGMIDPALRGGGFIHLCVLHGAVSELWRYPGHRVFGVGGFGSYISYLGIARGVSRYWPRYDQPTPPFEQAVLNAVMPLFSGSYWKPERGVIESSGIVFHEGKTSEADLSVPEIAFYERMNPGQSRGDALACIVPLDLSNMASAAIIGVKKQLRRLRRTLQGAPAAPPARQRESAQPPSLDI